MAPAGTGRQVWRDAQKDGGMAGRIDREQKVETGLKNGAPVEGMSGNVNGVTAH